MKRNIVAIFLLFALSWNLNGQTYLNETARWTQSYSWYGFNANSLCHSVWFIDGDSLILDTTYFKLYKQDSCYFSQLQYDSLGNPFQVTDTSSALILGMLLREENGKFIQRTGQQETMLYDFEMSDFTSISNAVQNPVCGLSNPSLMTHDTVCIGNSMRKRWIISPSQYPLASSYIEGVGPSSGFNAPICRNGCPECSYSLNFFELNGDTLYLGNCMPLQTSNLQNKEIQINFVNGKLVVDAPSLNRVELFSLDGSLIENLAGDSDHAEFAIHTMVPGIYMFSVYSATTRFSGKFIIVP
jgi:hypothetical protein